MRHVSEWIGAAFEPAALRYDPRLAESPIEEDLARALSATVRPPARWGNQVPAPTICGTFRLDFLLEHGGLRIGLECDGADFHSPFRDRCRDALILWSGHADQIVRISGRDLAHAPMAALALYARFERRAFPSISAEGLDRMSRWLMGVEWHDDEHLEADLEGEPFPHRLRLTWRSKDSACPSADWMRHFYDFAWRLGAQSLDQTIEAYLGARVASGDGVMPL